MFKNKCILTFFFILLYLGTNAQIIPGKITPLLAHEKGLLDLVTKDTINEMSVDLKLNEFSFGIPKALFTGIAFIKRKNKILIQPMGTGRVYEVKKVGKDGYNVIRIDSTIHTGVNFNSFSFLLHDSLFQIGGNGFWNIRGIITYFSKKTKQWELLNTSNSMPLIRSDEMVLLFKAYEESGKIYTSNSIKYINFPNSLSSTVIDSCYEFSFSSRKWNTLGALNPILKNQLTNGIDLNLSNKKFNAFTRELDFFWVNFTNNTYGKFKDAKNNEIKQEWLSFYPENELTKHILFSMGDSLYLLKINKDYRLEHRSVALTNADFDLNNTDYIYFTNQYNIANIVAFTKQYWIYILLLIMIGVTNVVIYKKQKNKKTTPFEVMTILYNNFYSSLSVIEKELIKVLFEYQQKGTELNTKIINKIIGVQQKDTLTQNKSRSDHFIKINQKFSLATQQNTSLIIKNRDAQDKRQFNYTLNLEYITEIGKLLQAK
jgi:hypothetical protein